MTDLQILQNNNNFDKSNKIDNISLDGTQLDELRQIAMNMPTNRDTNFNNLITPKINFDKNFNNNMQNNNQNNNQNKEFIKSITKEIINNLKENNISFDGDTNKSLKSNRSNKSSKSSLDDDSDSAESLEKYIDKDKEDDDNDIDFSNKKYKKNRNDKENIKNIIRENFEDIVESNSPIKNSKNFMSYIFDDCFGIKDFVLLFSIYFILSQDMIKDVFGQYFTSINPDDYGRVGAKGVIIYGLILTIIYMVSRRLI